MPGYPATTAWNPRSRSCRAGSTFQFILTTVPWPSIRPTSSAAAIAPSTTLLSPMSTVMFGAIPEKQDERNPRLLRLVDDAGHLIIRRRHIDQGVEAAANERIDLIVDRDH